MQTKFNLPLEIINKILIMRPTHPIVKIIVQEIYNYENYIDGDYNIPFYEYITNLKDLYEVFNIKKLKNNSDNLTCTGCNNIIRFNEYYMRNSFNIHCKHC